MIEINRTPLPELRALAARGVPAWLCVNPVEYHGPHLSLRNDQIISDGLMREGHARIQERHPDWPLVYAGELGIGADPVPALGSVDVPYRQVLHQTRLAVRRLEDLGFSRVIIMTFHGSPFHNAALWEAALSLQSRGVRVLAPMNLLTRHVMAPDPDEFPGLYDAVPDPVDRERMKTRAREDFHAGFGETSLSLHYAPETVHGHQEVPPAPVLSAAPAWHRASQLALRLGRRELAIELEFIGLGMAWFGLKPFLGYCCEPALASPEAGAALAGYITDALVEAVDAVLVRGEPSPPPVLRWVSRLTLGGLYGRTRKSLL